MAAYQGNEFTIESCEETSGRLTNRHYVRLGRAISSPDMESIALGYLNIDDEIIKSLRYEHRGNSEAFNRDILKRWAYRNPGSNQVKVRKQISNYGGDSVTGQFFGVIFLKKFKHQVH